MRTIKLILIMILNLFITINLISQTVNWDWAKHAGGNSDDVGYSITTDNGNNIIIVGTFNNNASFGTDILSSISIYGGAFVAKIDSSGNFLWSRRVVGTHFTSVYSVTTG